MKFFKKNKKVSMWLGRTPTESASKVGKLDDYRLIRGDFDREDCVLARLKESRIDRYGCIVPDEFDITLYEEKTFPSVSAHFEDYENTGFLANPLFSDAIILERKIGFSHKSTEFLIASKKHIELYKQLKEKRYYRYVNDQLVDEEEYRKMSESCVCRTASTIEKIKKANILMYNVKNINTLTREEDSFILVDKEQLFAKCVLLSSCIAGQMNQFIKPVVDNFFLKEDYDNFVEELKKPHEAYRIIGTDKPPYFIILGKIVESDTTSWYEFVLKHFFEEPQPWMLEKF